MKTIIKIVLFLIIILSSTICQAQNNKVLNEAQLLKNLSTFPDYREVVTHFFSHYYVDGTFILSFAKKTDGWYVYSADYFLGGDTFNFEKIWSFSSGKYRKLKHYSLLKKLKNKEISGDKSTEEKVNEFVALYDEYEFELQPFYGYIGWINDVIGMLSKMELKTDKLNYALGRAYSRYASSVIRPQYGNEGIVYPPTLYEKVEQKRLSEFLNSTQKSLDLFYKVYEINPHFETMIGSIFIKYCNELMHTYFTLLSVKEVELANEFLKDSLYNESTIALSKNYLISCPQNAILITYGDNDTYPLWYIQAKYGFRSDVRVCNYSLMMTEWYNEMLRENYLNSESIKFSFNPEKIHDNKRSYVIYSLEDVDTSMNLFDMLEYSKSTIELKKILKLVFNNDTSNTDSSWQQDNDVINIPKVNYFVYCKKDTLFVEPQGTFFLRNYLVLLDMISENHCSRPICFGTTCSEDLFSGFQNNLMQTGMAYQLFPEKHLQEKEWSSVGWLNTEIMYDNLLNKFYYPDFTRNTDIISKQIIYQFQNYRSMFTFLAKKLLNNTDTNKAREILNFCEKVIPNKIIPHDKFSIPLTEVFYSIGEFNHADNITISLIDRFLNDYKLLKSTGEKNEINYIQIRQYLETLLQITSYYHRIELSEKIKQAKALMER